MTRLLFFGATPDCRWRRALLAASALCLSPGPGAAQTQTQAMTITATIQASCTASATPLAFGTYVGAQIAATATLTVTCTNTTGFYMNMGDGNNHDNSYYPRVIGPGGFYLGYRLYQDAAHTIEWRNTYNLDGKASTGTGNPQTFTIYGVFAAGQYGPPGAYTDTFTATLTY